MGWLYVDMVVSPYLEGNHSISILLNFILIIVMYFVFTHFYIREKQLLKKVWILIKLVKIWSHLLRHVWCTRWTCLFIYLFIGVCIVKLAFKTNLILIFDFWTWKSFAYKLLCIKLRISNMDFANELLPK